MSVEVFKIKNVRSLIERVLTAFETGTYSLYGDNLLLHVPSRLNVSVERNSDSLVLRFLDPAPSLHANYGIAKYTARVQAITCSPRSVVIALADFPDLEIEVES